MTRYEILKHRCENASKKQISEFAKGMFLSEIVILLSRKEITYSQFDECIAILGIDRSKYIKEIEEHEAVDEDDNIDVGD